MFAQSAAGRAVDAAMWPQRCQECPLSVRRLDDLEDRVVARGHRPEANWSLLTVAPSHGGSLSREATALKPRLPRRRLRRAARRRAPAEQRSIDALSAAVTPLTNVLG